MSLKKKLAKANTNTNPILNNHILRIFQQYHGGFNLTPINLRCAEPHMVKDFESFNAFLEIGIENIISGVITSDVMEIQQRYANEFNVGDKFSILTWNRTVIQPIMAVSIRNASQSK